MNDLTKAYAVIYYCDGGWHVFSVHDHLGDAYGDLVECAGTICTTNVKVIGVYNV